MEEKYRVFLSYSHGDFELVTRIADVLEANGLQPLWDRNFSFGHGFPEQIRDYIAHAHVFMPVITQDSSERGWVHQEIGYAMALNVPVLPVTRDRNPSGILQQLLALPLSEDPDLMKAQLSERTFQVLVQRAQKVSRPLYECAEHHEDRTIMMVEYATRVLDLGCHGEVRQKGALSSFHIPDKPLHDPIWQLRYGRHPVSEYRCRWLREERRILQEHALARGCRLIIDPTLSYGLYGPKARVGRLETLLQFLEAMPEGKVVIGIHNKMAKGQSLTVVGDWFAAEAVSASLGKGYRQTVFTRYAPSVRSKVEQFDHEMEIFLQDRGWSEESSKQECIALIREILGKESPQAK